MHIYQLDLLKLEELKEYNRGFVKLTEYFGYKKNYTAADGRKYYAGMRKIAKKLGLI